jgi:hypothetical protein
MACHSLGDIHEIILACTVQNEAPLEEYLWKNRSKKRALVMKEKEEEEEEVTMTAQSPRVFTEDGED